jgi:hypothetical protein
METKVIVEGWLDGSSLASLRNRPIFGPQQGETVYSFEIKLRVPTDGYNSPYLHEWVRITIEPIDPK